MTPVGKTRRVFEAHENPHALRLSGLPLATFWQRILGFHVDLLLALLLWFPIAWVWHRFVLHEEHIELHWDFHEAGNILVILLYWGVFNYFGNGRSPGKWVTRTRIASLMSERMGAWQSVERALGYGAAILECGLGFLQFFWDRNRMCAQDRLAETIVLDLRK
jgi:uncharacterized RDD family membrane protein YckC